jgi:hypothetical protein
MATLVLIPVAAHEATRSKQDNTDPLNLASSWDALPGAASTFYDPRAVFLFSCLFYLAFLIFHPFLELVVFLWDPRGVASAHLRPRNCIPWIPRNPNVFAERALS